MPRKTRKQKRKTDTKKHTENILTFSYKAKTKKEISASEIDNKDNTLIKNDILKTLVLGFAIIAFEIILYINR